jgi:plastocyanin
MTAMRLLTIAAIVAIASAAAAADFRVVQRDKKFTVDKLDIRVGDTVRFTNDDEVSHNVYSATPEMQFEVRIQQPGQSDKVTFTKPGTALVQCAIHPLMKLRVSVAP